jgi:hypothetical protein
MSKETADGLSGTYWDQNIELRDALLRQSRTAAAGLVLVAVGTGLQLYGLMIQ